MHHDCGPNGYPCCTSMLCPLEWDQANGGVSSATGHRALIFSVRESIAMTSFLSSRLSKMVPLPSATACEPHRHGHVFQLKDLNLLGKIPLARQLPMTRVWGRDAGSFLASFNSPGYGLINWARSDRFCITRKRLRGSGLFL